MTRALVLMVALLAVASLAAGKVWVDPRSLLAGEAMSMWIVTELRVPRALLAILTGAGLGAGGAVLQGYLRNPLADPALVGISATAALGAVIAIVLIPAPAPALLYGCAMAAAAVATLLLVGLSGRASDPSAFILAGLVLSSLAGALTAFLLSVAPDPFASASILDWMMGALTDRGYGDVARAAAPIAVGLALLWTTRPSLDALTLGEAAAQSLGIDLARLRLIIVAGLCLTVGASVAVTGVVGFVGLIVPHLVRSAGVATPSATIVPSALGGAALVLAADSLVRLTPGPGEVRLGVAMAMIGAPFFFAMLLRARRA